MSGSYHTLDMFIQQFGKYGEWKGNVKIETEASEQVHREHMMQLLYEGFPFGNIKPVWFFYAFVHVLGCESSQFLLKKLSVWCQHIWDVKTFLAAWAGNKINSLCNKSNGIITSLIH